MAKQLRAEQYIAIQWLAQPQKGGKTLQEIADMCGVHVNTIINWKKEPTFEAELKREMVRRSQEQLPELIESLAKIAIRDGNAAMAKLALQINGMLTDRIEVETKGNDTADINALQAKIDEYKKRTQKADESQGE